MAFRWLVNAILLGLPMGTTVGVLRGIDIHRASIGQSPLFDGSDSDLIGGGSGSGSSTAADDDITPGDNNITTSQYCQKSLEINPATKGTHYIFNPNQWGWTEGTEGSLCMNISTFNNHTYATNTTAPDFSVTWQYPAGDDTAPVHAYPNIKLSSDNLPVKLSKMKSLTMDIEWSYGIGTTPVAATNITSLTTNLVNANVAVDMFLDSSKSASQNSTKASFEFMVWFAMIGDSAEPIGLQQGSLQTQVLNNVTLSVFFLCIIFRVCPQLTCFLSDLYAGQNDLEQYVLTWLAPVTTEKFSGDIMPLFTAVLEANNATFPTSDDYLGSLQMGSEAFYSNVNVTFSVPAFSVDL
ncbi:concanavalin A-like lectin/glucanase domain-containing protein, partial [Calycina marina]